MKRIPFPLLLIVLTSCFAQAEPTIFVVRHAEEENGGANDPELSLAGRQRAEALARVLADAEIRAVYVTECKRTQETAAPLCRTAGLQAQIVLANDSAALVEKLRAARENVLVVGHSNTIPALLRELGLPSPPEIRDADYGNLYLIVTGVAPRLLHLHY